MIASAFHPVEGGIETYMYQVAKNWPHGESVVFTQGLATDEPQPVSAFKVHRLHHKSGSYILNLLRLAWWVRLHPQTCFLLASNRDFVKRETPRVRRVLQELSKQGRCILQAATVIPNGVIGLIAKRVSGGKLVVYLHGSEINRFKKKLNNRMLLKAVLSNADCIIANSRYTASLVSDLHLREDVLRTVNIGADTSRFFPLDSRGRILSELAIPRDAFVFLTMGRLIRRKGHDRVLQALAGIGSSHDNAYYVIAGRGPEERRLRELVEQLGVSERVRFTGYIPHHQVNDYLNSCDCFIMANREESGDVEGYGLVFLEAAACRKPAIAGRSGGAVEAVLHDVTGLLVDPSRPDEIARAMELMITDPELASRLAGNGFSRVRGELNWETVCSIINTQILELFIEKQIDPC